MYSRELDGKTLTLGVSGKLWNNALVMYDRETDSLWSHVTGEAIAGEWKGKHLVMLASMPRITWAAWRKLHHNTTALSVMGHEDAPMDHYAAYEQDPQRTGLFPIQRPDNRAEPKEMVLGVAIGNDSKAYLHSALQHRRLLSDKVGATRILIYFEPETGATGVYEKPGEGDFNLDGDVIIGPNGKWEAATGRSLSGGLDLKALPHTNAYWFGWAAFYPHTELYR